MRRAKKKLYSIIFEHDTKLGKAFDVALILLVLASVVVILLESVKEYWLLYHEIFYRIEWFFTILFTLELTLRLYASPNKKKYLLSFYGAIDVLAVLPTYLAVMIPSAQAFIIIRALRLLRIFRILKLSHYTKAGNQLSSAMAASRPKIIVFLFFVVTLVTIVGTAMFFIEGRENGFTSIPKSIYWAIVTMTTVGYGDITPLTPFGQVLSALLMVVGYGVIAVPTGIISTEMARLDRPAEHPSGCSACEPESKMTTNFCPECGRKAGPQVKEPK